MDKVTLQVRGRDGFSDHPDPRFHSVPIKKAVPFWHTKRGFYVHRIKRGVVFIYEGGRISVDFWCGNTSNGPVPCDPLTLCECYVMCQRCEIAWEYRRHAHAV